MEISFFHSLLHFDAFWNLMKILLWLLSSSLTPDTPEGWQPGLVCALLVIKLSTHPVGREFLLFLPLHYKDRVWLESKNVHVYKKNESLKKPCMPQFGKSLYYKLPAIKKFPHNVYMYNINILCKGGRSFTNYLEYIYWLMQQRQPNFLKVCLMKHNR